MRSFASVDQIEAGHAVCEVELIDFQDSNPEDFDTKSTFIADVPLDLIESAVGSVEETDILVVEHNTYKVFIVYKKDDSQKEKRQKVLEQIANC